MTRNSISSPSWRVMASWWVKTFALLALSGACFGQAWSGVLAPARAADWTQAGILGFTPTSLPSDTWTQSGSTIAACGTGGSPVSPATCGITAALNTANGTSKYVLLGAGTFHLTGAAFTGYNKTELRGSGPLSTTLVFHGTATCQGGSGSDDMCFQSSDNTDPNGASIVCNVTGGMTWGSTSITISSGCNDSITASRTLIVMDWPDTGYTGNGVPTGSAVDNGNWFNCGDKYATTPTGCSGNGPSSGRARTNRFQREVVLAVSCSPSCGTAGAATLTLDRAIMHPNAAVASNPQVYIVQPTQLVGFRDMTVDDSNLNFSTNCSGGGSSIGFKNFLNIWVKNVAFKNSCNDSLWLDFGLGADIESNYSFNAGQNLTAPDPTSFLFGGCGFYVVNNILQGSRETIFTSDPTCGSVIAYNFNSNPYEGNGFQYPGCADGHSNGADLNLWESNVCTAILNDLIHGTHIGETYFRNLVTGWKYCGNGSPLLCGSDPSANSAVSAFGVLAYHRYDNLVSNVVGTSGVHTTYQENSACGEFDNNIEFLIGCGNAAFTPAVPTDSGVGSTVMRWDNYDVVNNAVLLCTAAATPIAACSANERGNGASTYPALTSPSSTIPASFVFSSRPPWYSASIPFPAIGGDVTSGNVGNCNGTRNTAGQYGSLPATNASQCAGQGLNTSGAAAWGGHVNAIPAMVCFFALGGVPDGSNTYLSGFDAGASGCNYYASAPGATDSVLGVKGQGVIVQ